MKKYKIKIKMEEKASKKGARGYGRERRHRMRFRPCIDIHNGKVKQIVGGSLRDEGSQAVENFVAEQDAAWFARLYQAKACTGGHVILLNPPGSEYYRDTKKQALEALRAYPGGLQVGGGITDQSAEEFLRAGASHVIVTSFVFRGGQVNEANLERLVRAVGREQVTLDVSCRKDNGRYMIVTDRWQKFTDVELTPAVLDWLSGYCSEFLIHAVDVEGKASGIEADLVRMLADWGKIPMTYAGGVGNFDHLQQLKELGQGKLDVTIGSALDLFGGPMNFEKVLSSMG